MEGHHAANHQYTAQASTLAADWGRVRAALQAVTGALDLLRADERPDRPLLGSLLAIATIRSRFDVLASDPCVRQAGCGRLVEALGGSFDRVEGAVDEFLRTRTPVSLHRLRRRVDELLDGVGELEALLAP